MNKEERKMPQKCNADKAALISSIEEFVIPYEAACSPEFSEGCIIAEEEND